MEPPDLQVGGLDGESPDLKVQGSIAQNFEVRTSKFEMFSVLLRLSPHIRQRPRIREVSKPEICGAHAEP